MKSCIYGFGCSFIFVFLINVVVLFVGVGGIIFEVICCLWEGVFLGDVVGKIVMIVVVVGIFVNGVIVWLFVCGCKGDLNVCGVFLYMVVDVMVLVGVVVLGFVILFIGWVWVDLVVSLLIVVLIFYFIWSLL